MDKLNQNLLFMKAPFLMKAQRLHHTYEKTKLFVNVKNITYRNFLYTYLNIWVEERVLVIGTKMVTVRIRIRCFDIKIGRKTEKYTHAEVIWCV